MSGSNAASTFGLNASFTWSSTGETSTGSARPPFCFTMSTTSSASSEKNTPALPRGLVE